MMVGAVCLFLAAKVHYIPVSLKQAISTFFYFENRYKKNDLAQLDVQKESVYHKKF